MRKAQYDAIVRTLISPERVALWDRCEQEMYRPTRPQLRDQLTQEHIGPLVIKAVEKADSGDSILLKFMLEQIFGKAPQPSHEGRRR